jgi:CTP synthase
MSPEDGNRDKKYIFITGGVVSSLGKGIAAASIGHLLKQRGLAVTLLKFDPYLNVDPGTMNPFQHGEVFVTDDGAETDLDLGHYERYTDDDLSQVNNVTAGQIYEAIIERERRGGYLGRTVQVVPDVTDEIKSRIEEAAASRGVDVIIVEIGGTTGDIESLPFLEAIRQFRLDYGMDSTLYIHVTLVPFINAANEIKTKPTQHSVKGLREIGIQPDILLCRTEQPLRDDIRGKIALFCNVAAEAVIEARDVESIYEVPLRLHERGLDDQLVAKLRLEDRAGPADLSFLRGWLEKLQGPRGSVEVAVVGKYVRLRDAYKSIVEAFTHAAVENGVKVGLRWVDAEEVERSGPERVLEGVGGILVPGGFGERGTEGKIQAVGFARKAEVPYLGICLGLQCAVIEFARSVCGLEGAGGSEFDPETPHPVIDLMSDQKGETHTGGTMRLGAYPCRLQEGSLARRCYGVPEISERHRHRWEVNNRYRDIMAEHGLVFSGTSPDDRLVEIVELADHPYFVAVQFHPELKSRPARAHPLFRELVRAAVERSRRDGERAKGPMARASSGTDARH